MVRLRYVGIPAFAGRVGQALREEGVEASWEPPGERRGLQEMAEMVIVYYFCRGGDQAIDAAMKKIRGWLGPRGTIETDPAPGDSE